MFAIVLFGLVSVFSHESHFSGGEAEAAQFAEAHAWHAEAPPAPPADDPTTGAVLALVERLLPAPAAAKFTLTLLPRAADQHPVFEVRASAPDAPQIAGTSGVALASGVYWYLKSLCGCSVTWGAGQNGTNATWGVDQLALPAVLPAVPRTARHRAPTLHTWAFNVVGFSYSTAWWDWARWERELDWMALHGVNLALAFVGQEFLWHRLYADHLGLREADIEAYFAGPAYLSWNRMGNLQLFGGPLPAAWRAQQFALQRRILQRMADLGMAPVLPCFAGIGLPNATAAAFPNASWGHLPAYSGLPLADTGNLLLSPLDPFFAQLAAAWMKTQLDAYADIAGFQPKFFNCDTFNEMTPPTADAAYLAASSRAVVAGLRASLPDAVWIMQGWLFTDDVFWNETTVEAYLGGVKPDDAMIVQELGSEDLLMATRYHGYFGKPWLWTVIHNSGGARGVYGDVPQLCSATAGRNAPLALAAAANSTLVGIGYSPEAIEENPLYYELLLEVASWRTGAADPVQWVRGYGARRYAVQGGGSGAAALNATMDGVLRAHYAACLDIGCGHGKGLPSLMQRAPRPFTGAAPCRTAGVTACNLYDAHAGLVALEAMLALRAHVPPSGAGGYSYDLVDLAHQAVQWVFADAVRLFIVDAVLHNQSSAGAGAGAGTTAGASPLGAWLVEMVEAADALLATDRNYLLGSWVASARAKATNAAEAALYEHNARELISVSFPGDDDYGARSWSPTYAQYYAPRWGAFVNATSAAVAKRQPFDQGAFVAEWHALGQAWATGHAPAPTAPAGDIAALAAAWLGGLSAPLAQQFERVADTDVRGGVLAGVMTTDVRAMAALCAKWPRCRGFTSDGQLRSDVGPGGRVPAEGGGCGRNSAYQLVAGFDLCTADTCNDFAPASKQCNRFPQGRNLRLVRPASVDQLQAACEATPRCSGFSTASWGNATALGGWLKGGTIHGMRDISLQLNVTGSAGPGGRLRPAEWTSSAATPASEDAGELTARADANLYVRVNGAVTTECDLFVKISA